MLQETGGEISLSEARGPARLGRGHSAASPSVVIAICSVAVFFVALEIAIVSVALPDIEVAFSSSSRATVSWVSGAHHVAVASLLLIGGWLSERRGRKRALLSGLWIFAIGSLVSGLAPSLSVLIAARVVQAIGRSLLIPASLALILQAVEPARRQMAVGVWGAAAGLAAAAGPTVGAALLDAAGWRWAFLVNVPVAAGAAVLGGRRLEESSDPAISARVDRFAMPVGAMAIALLVLGIVVSKRWGWTDPWAVCSIVAGVLVLAALARRSSTFDATLVRTRSFSVAEVATLFFGVGFTGWLVLAPRFLVDIWGYSTLRSGLAVAPGPIMMALIAAPAGRWAALAGHRVVITAGALGAAVAATWWAALVGDDPDYLVAFFPGTVLLGVGVGLAYPILTAAALRDVVPSRVAVRAAGNTTVRQVATAVGIGAAVATAGSGEEGTAGVGSFQLSWLVAGALFLAAASVIWIGYPAAKPPDHSRSITARPFRIRLRRS